MQLERFEVAIAVDASGNGTGFTPIATGSVQAIRYVPDASTPYATGVDITVTAEVSGLPIVTITDAGTVALQVYPRAAVVSVANAAALYAAGGTAITDKIPIAGERIKIAVAQGGVSTSGKFHVYVG
jgi:hypothetical protein